MSRKPPAKNPPVVNTEAQKPGWLTEIRKYKVITPLFGGGEEPQKPDLLTTVRATEVRGHLRFWWRATRGSGFDGNLAEMKKREEFIWGSPAEKDKPGPSKINVRVISAQRGKASSNDVGQPGSRWSYVAFPLREEELPVYEGVSFELEINYKDVDKIKEDVEAALWAWETFGGIGGRTRRGFGALQCEGSPRSTVSSVKTDIQSGLDRYVADGIFPDGVPHLSRTLEFRTIAKGDAMQTWVYLFTQLKEFRQHRQPPKDKRPGRSHWPEPDSVRQILTDGGVYKFGVHLPAHVVQKRFPRAKFGLPIQFEFPKKADKDPDKTTLQGMALSNGKSIERLASPLIIRPIACEENKAVGLAAILKWIPVNTDEPYTPPGGLWLTGDYGEFPVKSNLDESDAKNIEPLKNINGKPQPDVLQAFLDSLK